MQQYRPDAFSFIEKDFERSQNTSNFNQEAEFDDQFIVLSSKEFNKQEAIAVLSERYILFRAIKPFWLVTN